MDEAMVAGANEEPAKKNTYTVWAPRADEIQLVLNGETHPMSRAGEWFTSEIEPQLGDRYGFKIDGGDPIADPCSRRQPDGIHGLSEHWEIDRPRSPINTDLAGQVLYELHVGTFTPEGTLDSAVDKLDYLAELGVTAVELMPVQPFGGQRNWGYDGVYWHAVSEVYGGPDALVRFIDAAHSRGLAVVLDVVYNHFGPDGAYGNLFGPYTAGGSTGWGEVVNLQGKGSDGVRKYILEAVRQWTQDFGIDGLRLDAVHAFDDTGAFSITEQIRDAAAPSFVIAETDQNDPRYTEQFGIAQWDDDIHHAIHAAVSGEVHGYYADFGSTEVLAETLKNGFWHDGKYSTFRGRTHGRALDFDSIQRHQLVTYTTTHDQTGNRARGDRPSMNLTGPQQVLKAALVLISPYTPMLFMGEEWGASTPFAFFVDHENADLNDATRAGRLREFSRMGWAPDDVPDPAAAETYEASKLKWEERLNGDHARIAEAYRDLIEMRAQLGIADADVVEATPGDGWVRMGYATEAHVVTVLANLSDATRLPSDGHELGPWEVRIDVAAREDNLS
ncbi:malto-oligosyltrehalose trehalohydrolase [Corynebacterium resistens]